MPEFASRTPKPVMADPLSAVRFPNGSAPASPVDLYWMVGLVADAAAPEAKRITAVPSV
jgi:hypothetical protein